ncbi:MAG: lectin like domain-containing protein [Ruminococcus flavefaciens]|nr:lectin like domain-containing protein [Ruminococcus flavefaciens]MCM1229737.1 lectin like domain-containing protein [Ruminococcus flavefaciens]
MIKQSTAVFLAVLAGLFPIANGKKASFSSNFSLSAPHFSRNESGGTDITPYFGAVKNQVNINDSADSLPASFDLRESGKVTPVRDQTGYGTCWAHSAIASAETSIIDSKPGIDLSEFHTAYYTYSGGDQIEPVSDNIADNFSRGGTIYTVTNLWAQGIGPVLEKRLRYGDIDFFEDESDVEMMKYQADYHLKNAYMFDYDKERTNFDEVNNLIKQFVYSGSAVDVSFYSNQTDSYYNAEYFTTNSNKRPKFANHSVAVVGWDDDFPSENFVIQPENNGAWLVKNSWGEDFGDNGYMWISYEDTSLCEFAVYELEDTMHHDRNYHHDTFVALQSLSADDSPEINNGSYMANVFCEYSEEVQIEAVSTYINVPETDYEITVYTELDDISDPTSGTPSTVTKGHCSLTGYFTLELDEDVIVEPDEYFSVVVKLYSENSPYVIPIETAISVTDDETGYITSLGSFTTYYGIESYTGENESFYSADGENWTDVTSEHYIYTDDEELEILAELEEDLYDGIEPDDTEGLENAGLALEFYRELLASGTTSVSMGNISLKAHGSLAGMVHFSHDSGVVPKGTGIELSAKNNEDIYYFTNDGEITKYTEPIVIDEMTDIYVISGYESESPFVFLKRTFIPDTFAGYGDVNADGHIDANDASMILYDYALSSTGGGGMLYGTIEDYADINQDSKIDSSDASRILKVYAEFSTN